MRVGIPLPEAPEHAGGGYTFERDLIDGFLEVAASSAHEFVLFGFGENPDRDLPANVRYHAVPPERPASKSRAARLSKRAAHLADRVRRYGLGLPPARKEATPSSIIAAQVQFALYFRPYAVSFDVPFLTCVWDLEYRSQPYFPELSDGGKWNFREQHFSTLVRRATAVVTGTEVGKQQLRDFFQVPNERILLLPHPTPRDALAYSERPTSSKGAERSTERPIVLYPAQFWPHKNHITLLRAARVLREKHHCNCVVVLTGADYGNQAHVEQTARDLGLGDSVRFEGFVSRERLFDLYRQASIMAYPSTFGPENLPPLEAFALGCPVVASRIPGAEQQLGDAALLVDVYDHEALALAIHRVLTEPALRETLIERGRVRAAKWTSVDFGKAIVQFLDRFAVIRSLWP